MFFYARPLAGAIYPTSTTVPDGGQSTTTTDVSGGTGDSDDSGGLLGALGKWFDSVTENISEVWSWIKELYLSWVDFLDWLNGKVAEFWQESVNFHADFFSNWALGFDSIKEWFSENWEVIKDSATGAAILGSDAVKTALDSGLGILNMDITDSLKSGFGVVSDGISGIPDKIKSIFIPDNAKIEASLNSVRDKFNETFSIEPEVIKSGFKDSESVGDLEATYQLPGYTYSGKFFDASKLRSAVEQFRPYIRGFLVILLVLFVINQVLSIINKSPLSGVGGGSDKGDNVQPGQGRLF